MRGNAPLASEAPLKAWHCAQAGAPVGVPCAAITAPRSILAARSCGLRLHDGDDEAERTKRGDCPRGKQPVACHACTNGPGDFRYLFLMRVERPAASAHRS